MGWLTGYAWRKQITIAHTGDGAQTNYQMVLTVNKAAGTDAAGVVYLGVRALSWTGTVPNDVRFTKSDGTTELDYWIESSDANTAQVWIEFDAIPAHPDDATFYIYYGKASDTTTTNGINTFVKFSDFETGSDGDTINGLQGWAVWVGSVKISTDHNSTPGGSRCGKWFGVDTNSGAYQSQAPTANLALRLKYWKETACDFAYYNSWGNGSKRTICLADVNEDIYYYDTAFRDTGANITADQWELMEITNLNYTAGTFDMWRNGTKVKTGAVMQASAGYTNLCGVESNDVTVGDDFYIDDFIIRNWTTNEPTWGAWGAAETIKTSSCSIGLAASASKAIELIRSGQATVGLAAVGSRVRERIKTGATAMGLVATGQRSLELSRTGTAVVGLAATSRLLTVRAARRVLKALRTLGVLREQPPER